MGGLDITLQALGSERGRLEDPGERGRQGLEMRRSGGESKLTKANG